MAVSLILGISFCILGADLSFAQEESCTLTLNKQEIPKITITQTGKVEAEPDKAIVDVSFTIEEVKIQKTFDKNKEKMNQAIDILKKAGVEKKDIKTTRYEITPLYEGKPLFSKVHRPTSYVVSQSLKANIYQLDSLGEILNGISEIESARVAGIEFTSTKLDELKRTALKKAAGGAKEAALAMVEAAGGKLGKILKIEESSVIPILRERREYSQSLMKDLAVQQEMQPQVEPGTLTVQVACTVVYEVEKAQPQP